MIEGKNGLLIVVDGGVSISGSHHDQVNLSRLADQEQHTGQQ